MTTQEKLDIAIQALQDISLPSGAYSRDPLEHANNTIENVAEIARTALEKIVEDYPKP